MQKKNRRSARTPKSSGRKKGSKRSTKRKSGIRVIDGDEPAPTRRPKTTSPCREESIASAMLSRISGKPGIPMVTLVNEFVPKSKSADEKLARSSLRSVVRHLSKRGLIKIESVSEGRGKVLTAC